MGVERRDSGEECEERKQGEETRTFDYKDFFLLICNTIIVFRKNKQAKKQTNKTNNTKQPKNKQLVFRYLSFTYKVNYQAW